MEKKGPLRFTKYIFILIAGIFIAKGLFFFLDKHAADQQTHQSKDKPKIKITQPVKPEQPIAAKSPAAIPKQIIPPELRLSGVASSGKQSWAVINNRIVKLGDTIKGARVISIYSDEVELEFEGKLITLRVK